MADICGKRRAVLISFLIVLQFVGVLPKGYTGGVAIWVYVVTYGGLFVWGVAVFIATLLFQHRIKNNSNLSITGVVISSTLGSVVGAIVLYYIGYLIDATKMERIISKWGRFWVVPSLDDPRFIAIGS